MVQEESVMVTDDVIAYILEQTQIRMGGIDQVILKQILQDTMFDYQIIPKEELEMESDLPEKIEKYLSCGQLDGMSPETLKNYRYHLVRFANYIQKRSSVITTQDIRQYLSNIVESRKIKNSTLEGEKSILKSFFSWLEDEEYIVKSPAKKIKPTRCIRKVRDSLSVEELELMRDACQSPRQRCLLELFYSTGMRLAELCQVNVDDLNWQNNSIKIIGKGNKERIVYFSDKSRIYIKKYLNVRGVFDSSALFITSKSPHKRMGRRSIEIEINKISDNAKLDKHVFPHLLRHSFATQGSRSGMSLTSLHQLLGHSRLDTTLIYVDADQETAAYEHRKYLNQ